MEKVENYCASDKTKHNLDTLDHRRKKVGHK